jgi:MraZ protein
MFVGTTTNGMDAKGRVSVPAEFRATVTLEGFAGIYVWPSFNGAFLEGGGIKLLESYYDAVDQLDPYDPTRTSIERTIFGGVKPLMFDSTGRVSMPKPFADHAHLSNQAVFIGMGKRFEIWNPEAHAAQIGPDLENARENRSALRTRRARPEGRQ